MNKEYLRINDAYLILKEGLVVVDNSNNRFKLIDKRIIIKGENIRCNLTENEFLLLYKNTKFLVLEDSDQVIDSKKDEEYYNFKHK